MAAINKLYLLQKRLLLLLVLRRRMCKRRQLKPKVYKECWVRKIFQEREEKGEFNNLVKELRLFDHEYFFRNFRMSNQRFEKLLSWVGPHIAKSNKRRSTTCPAERLIITLRYLATGDAQFTISSSYRVSPTTLSRIIRETTYVIWEALNENGYMCHPTTEDEWKRSSDEFFERWNFPIVLDV